jgi:membrane protein DedA with SNARE-associated domain
MEVLHQLSSIIIEVIDRTGYAGILVLMALEGSFIPVPSEIILPFSGFLASQGQFSIWAIALVGAIGNIIGTLLTYSVARYIGVPFLYKYGKYVLVSRADIDQAQRLFKRFGMPIIFISRLLPGIRGFVPIPAGIAKMNIIPFLFYVFVGSFLWSLFLTYIGFLLGEHWEFVGPYLERSTGFLFACAAIAIAWWVWHRIQIIKKESL